MSRTNSLVIKGIQLARVECIGKIRKLEDKAMYSKPEVVRLASSLEAIQHPTGKPVSSLQDSPVFHIDTPNAYAADE